MDKLSHRKSSVKIVCVKEDGKPLSKTEVSVKMTRHAFLFGSGGFEAVDYAGGTRDGKPLAPEKREYLRELLDKTFALFNYATLPFYWGRYEEKEGEPDERRTLAAARYFKERGVICKGHPLCWHTVCASWLLNKSNSEILRLQLARIKRETGAFRSLIDMWDVINEVVIMPVFDRYDNAVTRLCKELGQVNLVKQVFDAAREANPSACLLINDFDLSAGYEKLIERCLDAGIPLSAIGLQTHQHQGCRGLSYIEDVLARFSRFGLPLHFTENTLVSGHLMPAHIIDLNDYQIPEWPSTPEGEERQAREMLEMYETLFAHPAVAALTNWDAVDGGWLGAPSGLLRKDLSPKPAYHALMKKIKGEWTANAILQTNEKGEAFFEGFLGDYHAKICGGSSKSGADFTLSSDKKTEQLRF